MRATDFITETVAEQKEILELSKIVTAWLKNKIGNLEVFDSNAWEKGGEYYTDSLPPPIARASYLNRFYKGEYDINSILGTQSSIFKEPTMLGWLESDPTVTLQYLEDNSKGKYIYGTNNISINSNANIHALNEVIVWKSIQSTLSHEIQHALDFYKSHALMAWTKPKVTNKEANDEVQDINLITNKTIEYLQKLSGDNYQLHQEKIPKEGILLSNIINADQLKSVKFKNYINDPSLIISVIDYENIDTRTHSTSPFSDIEIRSGSTYFKDIKKFIHKQLNYIRSIDYTKIVGYDTSTERNEYLTQPIEINARLLQAFHIIDEKLLNMKFKGFSQNPNKRKQQQSVVMNVIQKVFAQKNITPDLFPNKKRNKMWNRLLSRTYLFFQEKFSQTSNKRYKSVEKNIDIEDFSKLISMALKGEI